ncbi:MAG: hypothetical protein KGL25_12610, partial [Gammaproteobacteria bacterium]|nr:hypothetical protein [Gammaproteobacteria bacterium]
RGWLPLPGGRRDRLPAIALPAGSTAQPGAAAPASGAVATIEISGRIDLLPVAAIRMGHAAPSPGPDWPKRTSFPTTPELAAALARPIEPRQLLLAASEPDGFARDWKPAGEGFGPARHLAYALQWWAFAALALFLYLFLNIERREP